MKFGRKIARNAQKFGRKVNKTATKFGRRVDNTLDKVENIEGKVNRNVQRIVPILQDAAITGGTLIGQPEIGVGVSAGLEQIGRASNRVDQKTRGAINRARNKKAEFEGEVKGFKDRTKNRLER